MTGNADADVAVVGTGPAGWAGAAALSCAGLRVLVIGDDRPWSNTYGIWRDEAAGLLADDELEAVWPQTLVRPWATVRTLPRAYARVDAAALRTRLVTQAREAGAEQLDARVVACAHDRQWSTLGCSDGSSVTARTVVDASGHQPALVARPQPTVPAAQVAVGWRGRLADDPYPPGSMVLMDFADDHLDASERDHDPTFCYAMDYGDGTWFVEETSLARRPPMDPTRLHDRLLRRLARYGAVPHGEGAREEVHIPLGSPAPPPQRVMALGAAAGLVHPATGYLLSFTLAAAPRLAGALEGALRDPGARPDEAAAAGWRAVWPPAARARHALYRFGLEALLRLDSRGTRAFFDAFFDLPAPVWQRYLSATLSPAALAAAMGSLFRGADRRVRSRLVRTALGRPSRDLVGELGTLPWRTR